MRTANTRWAALWLALTPISWAQAGGISTTGGVDSIAQLEGLLPETIEIYWVNRPQRAVCLPQVGERPGFGGWATLPVYARELELYWRFDREDWLANRPVSAPRVTAMGGGKRLELTMPAPSSGPPFLGSSPWECVYEAESTRRQLQVYWDHENLGSLQALRDRWKTLESTLLAQFDPEIIETWVPLARLQTLHAALDASLNRRILYQSSSTLTVAMSRTLERLQAQAEEIQALARQAVTPDGSCVEETYLSLRTRLRRWTLGNQLYFESLARAGVTSAWDYRETAQAIRRRAQELLLDSVLPVCQLSGVPVGESGEQNLDLD